jgi:hypothetical protein
MDWLCPGYNQARCSHSVSLSVVADDEGAQVLGRQLQTYHGNVTVDNIVHNIISIVQTGDLRASSVCLSLCSVHRCELCLRVTAVL